jgi:hypothetical protein
VKYSKCAFAKR